MNTQHETQPFSRLFKPGNNARRDAAHAPVVDLKPTPQATVVPAGKKTLTRSELKAAVRGDKPKAKAAPKKLAPAITPKAAKAAKARRVKVVTEAEDKPESSSVVKASFKERARATGGILRNDRIGTAIKNWFLAQDGKLTPQQQARKAVDALLAANQLEDGRWAGKNVGMLRMNITNVARAMLKRGESFTVDGKTYGKAALEALPAPKAA
jgi:hypothetical protein